MKRGGRSKNILTILLILIFSLSFSSSAEEISSSDIESKIDSIITYAERYEAGIINYLQLLVHAHSIREEVNEMLGKDAFEVRIGEEDYDIGLTEEAVRKIFGEPTDYDDWLWIENLEEEIRADELYPVWEKSVFDGKKIHMSFNAWPNAIMENEELNLYYGIDFEIIFKKNFDVNVNEIISDVKGTAEEYYETGTGEDLLLEKIILHENTLRDYIEQNKEDCINLMDNFFGSENKKQKEDRVRWRVEPHEDKYRGIETEVNMCYECE